MTKHFGFAFAEGTTHVITLNCKQSFGFTLAEVLITLGIIGVVAAMTMPTLMNQTNGAQYKAAYKKALSALSQAVTLNVALDDWDFSDAKKDEIDITAGKQNIYKILNDRMNIVKTDTSSGAYGTSIPEGANDDEKLGTSPDTFVYFNDGSMFAFNKGQGECTEATPCFGIIDVNGDKGPNKMTTCSGTYSGTSTSVVYNRGSWFIPAAVAAQAESTPTSFGSKSTASCTEVSNPSDIYPVIFYNQTVLPNSAAAKAVLYGK